MDEKKVLLVFLNLFWRHVASTFTQVVIAMTITGLVFQPGMLQGGLFEPGGGLAFTGVMQLFLWACGISLLITVLTSDIWFKKVMLLWRTVVLLFLGIALTGAFAAVFRWLPAESWEAWVGFIAFFTLAFGGGLTFTVAKMKIEDRRYNKLLSDYKSKRRANND